MFLKCVQSIGGGGIGEDITDSCGMQIYNPIGNPTPTYSNNVLNVPLGTNCACGFPLAQFQGIYKHIIVICKVNSATLTYWGLGNDPRYGYSPIKQLYRAEQLRPSANEISLSFDIPANYAYFFFSSGAPTQIEGIKVIGIN